MTDQEIYTKLAQAYMYITDSNPSPDELQAVLQLIGSEGIQECVNAIRNNASTAEVGEIMRKYQLNANGEVDAVAIDRFGAKLRRIDYLRRKY